MEPNEPDPSVKPPEKVWTKYDCKYTLPEPEGDIWANCLKPLKEEDEKQCQAWRDEVQNLLIFAGLFSAVVTTFVVDSYKNLQPSADQRTVDLLSQILVRLDNSSASFNPASLSSHASPSPSSIRVNTLWFTSLVISLTTVLIGIISLQWIREYENYSSHWTTKQIFELRNLRHESMNKWFVPQIFTGLPVLLQAALVLFFLGLMDFLLHLYPRTAIPTIIIASATLFFLVLTTVLPTLQQYTTTCKSQHPGMPTTPFPYKSPQSWILLRMAESIRTSLEYCKRWATYRIERFHYGPDHPIGNYPKTPAISNWNMFDWEWVCKRSDQAAGYTTNYIYAERSHHYDTAHGVANFIPKYCQSNKSWALSAYHSFLEQHNSGSNAVYHWSPRIQSHFYKCMKPFAGCIPFFEGDLACLPDLWTSRRDTSLRIFLGILHTHSSRIPGIDGMIIRQRMELLIQTSIHLGVSDVLDSALADECSRLYSLSVQATLNRMQWSAVLQPAAAGIAEVTAMMNLCSTPSFAEHREGVKYTHLDLARRILESGANHDAGSLGCPHRMGYAFVEHIFRGLNGRASLPVWSEEYKESLAFLVHAIDKTVDEHPETDHNPIIISRMRDFLSLNPLADLRDRLPKWCPLGPETFDKLWAERSRDPWSSNALVSAPSVPPEIPPTDAPALESIPDLDNTLIPPATPSPVILPPQTPSCGTNMEPANQPNT